MSDDVYFFGQTLIQDRDSLATESDYVRGKIAAYLNDLLSLGVEGLRIDAAKRKSTRVSRHHAEVLMILI